MGEYNNYGFPGQTPGRSVDRLIAQILSAGFVDFCKSAINGKGGVIIAPYHGCFKNLTPLRTYTLFLEIDDHKS